MKKWQFHISLRQIFSTEDNAMIHKKGILIACTLFLTLVILILLESCNLFMVTIERRILNFESHLNTDDRDNIFTEHFHPDADNAWASSLAWEASEFATANKPFSFSSITITSQTETTATVTGIMTNGSAVDFDIEYRLEKTSSGWLIKEIDLDGGRVI